MENNKWVRGLFQGEPAYVERDVLDGVQENGAIAPADHIEDGKLTAEAVFFGISLAHVFDYGQRVMCFHENLGTLSDVFVVEP